MAGNEFRDIASVGRWRAEHQPDHRAFTFLLDGEQQETTVTYAQLDARARTVAAALQARLKPGARVVLLYASGLDYIAALLGCLYASVVAVPTYPPDPTRLARTLPRLRAIVADCQAEAILTVAFIHSMAAALFELAPELQRKAWLVTDTLSPEVARDWRPVECGADQLAFLQYTSGSTGTPKGVMLTHGNLLANERMILDAFQTTPADVCVGWLPLYHDMGLIGNVLHPLYVGFPCVLMSPIDFLRRPVRWVQAVSRYGGTVSGGPNFAFDLCARRITPEQLAGLDLRCWTLAFNGAEPLRAETLTRFAEVFAPAGFAPRAFYPCYGLAEASLLVSGGRRAAPPVLLAVQPRALGEGRAEATAAGEPSTTLVGVGQVPEGIELRVVDPATARRCAAGEVGELWVSGANVASGYFGREQDSHETFHARLAGDPEQRFLRTGDLGFVRDGELFITGRLKDLIILRGRNHYPQDLELTAELAHPSVRRGCVAAFPLEGPRGESVGVAFEISVDGAGQLDAVIGHVRAAVAEQHEVQLELVVALRPGGLPKTSSGKIQRRATRQGVLDGTLDEVVRDQLPVDLQAGPPELLTRETLLGLDPSAREARLVRFLAERLCAQVGRADRKVDDQTVPSELGLDSMSSIHVAHELERALAMEIPPMLLLRGQPLSVLAHELSTGLAREVVPVARVAFELDQPLSPGQEALWFLQKMDPGNVAYNISHALRVRSPLDVEALGRAFGALVERHAILRTLYHAVEGRPVQHVHPAAPVAIALEHAESWTPDELQHRLAEVAFRPFDLSRGPLLRVAVYRRGEDEHVLQLVVHHIAADFWSLIVLLRELKTLYPWARSGGAFPLAPVDHTYADFVAWQRALLAGPTGRQLDTYWRQQLEGRLPVLDLPADLPRPARPNFVGRAQPFELPAALGVQLHDLARQTGTTVYAVLLTAFQVLLARASGTDEVIVGVPGAGRSRAAFEGVVGFFVNELPLRARLPVERPFVDSLRATHRQLLSAVEHQDWPFPRMVEAVGGVRDARRSPIFQASFVLEKPHRPDEQELAQLVMGGQDFELDLGGLKVSPFRSEAQVAQFDLTMYLVDTPSGIRGSLNFDHQLFSPRTAERLCAQFVRILEAVAHDAAAPIGDAADTLVHPRIDPERVPDAAPVIPGPPRNETERIIAQIWSEALGVPVTDRSEDFFLIGGHSTLAVRVLAKVQQRFGVEPPVHTFYEAPTIAALARTIDEDRAADDRPVALSRAGRSAALPLSSMQERLWFLHQLGGDQGAYHMPGALRLTGALQVPALQNAWAALVARHEPLRTRFPTDGGRPRQEVDPVGRSAVSRVDLGHDLGHEADREGRLGAVLGQLAREPFSLEAGPLARVSLIRLSEREHVLFAVLHHIICDGWSVRILLRDLAELYRAGCGGGPASLPTLSIQYADFAEWQRRSAGGFEAGLEHFRRALEDAPTLIDLPTDRPRPPAQSFRGAEARVRLPPSSVGALRRVCREQGTTLFVGALAAFGALLHRCSGQDDVVVGIPVAGRTRAEVQELVGFFANTVALRARFGARPSFRQLVAQLRGEVTGALKHQDVPFEQLVNALRPERSLSQSPLFQVMFDLAEEERPSPTFPGLEVAWVDVDRGAAQFDLALALTASGEGLDGVAEYSTDLFDEDSVRGLLHRLGKLIDAVVQHPDRPIAELPLIDASERSALIEGASGSALAAHPAPVTELFLEQARRAPQSVAVSLGDQALTYGELSDRSLAVAQALRASGVGEGDRVAILAGQTPERLVAVLGVLRAGAAFVPLDPSLPDGRIAAICDDAAVQWVAAQRALSPRVPAGLRCLELEGVATRQVDAALAPPSLRAAAYVTYTSGSTGSPKGVVVGHGSLTNYVQFLAREFVLDPTDRMLHYASFGFDVSVAELLLPLTVGGTCVMAPPGTVDPNELAALLADERITTLEIVPTFLRLVLEVPAFDRAIYLRRVFCGGEAMSPQDAARFFERSQATLVNAYGPTECTVDAAMAIVPPGATRTPIGRAVANTQLHVLDAKLSPVPDGVVGELYVQGAALALGYWGDSRLTAERFLPSPFDPGQRIYRTGDLGRRLPDRQVQFMARADAQLKVRGFRIEPAEVEAALLRHASVREAAVLGSGERDQRLIAYLVPRPEGTVHPGDLRTFLSASLPAYMVPQQFVTVPALPRTASGKLDRRALPRPDADRAAFPSPYVAPSTATEHALCAIFAEVLGLDRVGAEDDFFELGGDSILAVQVASRARMAGLGFELRELFRAPRVRLLANGLERGAPAVVPSFAPSSQREELVSARPELEDAYPLTPMQLGMLFRSLLDPGAGAYIEQLSCGLSGRLNPELFEKAWQSLVDAHPVLRTSFVWEGVAEPLQVVHRRVRLEVEQVDWTGLSEAEWRQRLDQELERDRSRPFDLTRPPAMRMRLYRLAADHHLFLWTQHHILLDGWCMGLLFGELIEAYGGFAAGRPFPAQSPASQYRDFIAWTRQRPRDPEERHWRQALGGISAPTPIVPAPKRNAMQAAARYHTQKRSLGAETFARMQEVARARKLTLSVLVQAAWAMLLRRYTGEEDVLFGAVFSGRSAPLPDIDRMLGLFVNTLPVRVSVPADPPVGEWLQGLMKAHAERVEHEHSSLMDVHGLSDIPRRIPLFESLVAVENQHFDLSVIRGGGAFAISDVRTQEHNEFPLTLFARPGQELALELVHDTRRLSDAAASSMVEHFVEALTQLLAKIDRPLKEVGILGPGQIRALRPSPPQRFPSADLIHQRFEAQVQARPEAIALVSGNERLTYAELNRRANRLAHALRSRGVGPEVRVGVWMQRSADLVVALLAILKAGGAYLPMDPIYPEDRVRFMLEDGGVQLLLTSKDLQPRVRTSGVETYVVEGQVAPAEPETDLPAMASESGLAYVIYTSGSTGKPKGVMVEHRNVVRLLDATEPWFHFGSSDVWTFFHSAAFDFSVWEIWGALLYGGRLVVVPYMTSRSPWDFYRLLQREKVTVLNQTPSAFRQLVAVEDSLGTGLDEELALRFVIFGGEALDPASLSAWFERHGDQTPRLINMYGITETTVHVTYRPISAADADQARSPIGESIKDLTLHLLDERLEPVPVGVAGELFVGGAGVARGYLNRPELTAARFLEDGTRGRLYRTGDLVRRCEDGELEYLGRIDHQVKVRGFRIELGEIEAALSAHPALRQAVVVAERDASGETQLWAYVVPGEDVPPIAQLRTHLLSRLPDYMVPSAFVFLDAIPTTSNGKVDRRALPRPHRQTAARSVEGPSSESETQLLAIWSDVLGHPVGLEENFFDAGGDSLKAIRVIGRLRERYGEAVQLVDLFTHATVRALAGHLAAVVASAEPRSSPEDPEANALEERRTGAERLQRLRRRRE